MFSSGHIYVAPLTTDGRKIHKIHLVNCDPSSSASSLLHIIYHPPSNLAEVHVRNCVIRHICMYHKLLGVQPQLAAVRRDLRVSLTKSVEKVATFLYGYEVSGKTTSLLSRAPGPPVRRRSYEQGKFHTMHVPPHMEREELYIHAYFTYPDRFRLASSTVLR